MSGRRGAVSIFLVSSAALYLFIRTPNPPADPGLPFRKNPVPPTQAASGKQSSASAAAASVTPTPSPETRDTPATPPPVAAITKPKPVPGGLEFTNLPPDIVLDNLRGAVRLYGEMMGGNPVGTNPEITSALNGNNPKQAGFLDPKAGLRINEKGELIDPWGTPFFFHQLSGIEMEIHSAGPDKILWTADDLVTR